MNKRAALIALKLVMERNRILEVLTSPGWEKWASEDYDPAYKSALMRFYVYLEPLLDLLSQTT